MHSQAMREQVCRCTCRPWLCELAWCNHASVDIHVKDVLESTTRCNLTWWLNDVGDALGSGRLGVFLVPVAVLVPPVRDPSSALYYPPTPGPTMGLIDGNSLCPWPSPSLTMLSKNNARKHCVSHSLEAGTWPSWSQGMKSTHIAPEPIRWQTLSAEPPCNTALHHWTRRLTWWTDMWRWIRIWSVENWSMPSTIKITEALYIRNSSWGDYVRTSRVMGMSARKSLSLPTTQSATIWFTREPWPCTGRWKWCSEPSPAISTPTR
jgi:hypothetical protein